MYKFFLTLALLILFISDSRQAAAQSTSIKGQPRTNIESRISSVSIVRPASQERSAEAEKLLAEGIRLTEVREFSGAVATLKHALRLDPEYADAYAALGRAYFKMRHWQESVFNLRRAAELRARQRGSQTAQRNVMVQVSKGFSSRVAAATGSPIKREAKSSHAPSKKTFATRPTQLRVENTAAKTSPVAPDIKPLSRTNVIPVELKTAIHRSVVPPDVEGTSISPVGPEIEPQPNINANPAESKVPIPTTQTQHREAATPATATETKSSAKLPEETKATAVDLKPLDAKLEATQPPNQEVVSTSETTRTGPSVPAQTITEGTLSKQTSEPAGVRVAMSVTPAAKPVETRSDAPLSDLRSKEEASLADIYRVGPSDVLDIQIKGAQGTQSTLFTVSPSGLLEHPMLTEPLPVKGLSVEEIGPKIENDLKKRALIENPKVVVAVRDYSSHTILVTGLIRQSGTKFLRREAIPLYVVVADAQPLPEAARITILRNEQKQVYEIDLAEVADLNLLVLPGDVITLHPNVTRYIYIGGEVKFPGEKTFRRGLTLMQAVIAAGGLTQKSKVAELARDDGKGFLVATRVSLNEIQSGRTVDPLLKPGDRITILR
jgi:protein involved in polysaccharide export with SLBB domain